MHDRYDEGLPEDPIKELITVAFLLNGVCQQLNQERETITLASGQMTHAVKQFGGVPKKIWRD